MSDEVRPDIAAARDRMRTKFGAKRELKRLPSYLWDNEVVEAMTGGAYGRGQGLVVLTNQRLFFLQDGVMSQTSEDFPLDKISSVQWQAGMLMGEIVVFASGTKAEIKQVDKVDGKTIVDAVRQRLSAPKQQEAPAPNPSSTAAETGGGGDVFEQLRKLGELRDAGIVTPEEFEAKKAELLSRL